MRTASLLLALAPLAAGAQTLCDSLVIERFTYDPFASRLNVRLRNNSSQFISYPYFDVLDAQGVNLVQGSPGFFGILPGTDQLHLLDVGDVLPSTPFTGALVLHYSTVDGDGQCTYDLDEASLCPSDSCFAFQVYIYSLSGPLNAQMSWTILDMDNTPVSGGAFALSSGGTVESIDEACLPPGEYTLHVQWPFPTGETIQTGVTASLFESDGPATNIAPDGTGVLPFTFFAPCLDIAQGLEVVPVPAPVLAVDGRMVRIASADGRALGDLLITDAMGRHVRTIRAGGGTATVDLGDVAAGTYLLRLLDSSTAAAAQRFILF
jgi:hypothetical protein